VHKYGVIIVKSPLPAPQSRQALPLFAKEGNTPLNPLLIEGKHISLCQREVRNDIDSFISAAAKQKSHEICASIAHAFMAFELTSVI